MYQKLYPEYFNKVQCPPGYKIPDFVKFSGDGTKTTWEHISQYLTQLGEVASVKELKIRLFPLSLIGTAFSWFSSLPHGSILVWPHLEQKFHDHFYSGDNELKLSHLTSVKKKNDESVSDYVKRFRNTKNRCYNLVISERDLADLVLNGLKTYIKDMLEGYEFLTINQVLQRALAQENQGKENKEVHRYKIDRPKVNMVEYDSDHSDDEGDVYTAEFVWPSKAKPFTCNDLKMIHKNRDDDMKFTFNIAKCDRIFYALLQAKFIRISHALPSFKELKWHAFCKYHNSFSHDLLLCLSLIICEDGKCI